MNILEEYNRTRQELFDIEGIQPQSKIIVTEGPVKNVHYLEMGQGKPLIMIHGGGSHASEFIPILKSLSNHFHLYVVDRPGHGLTDFIDYRGIDMQEHAAQFVSSFMDALRLDKAFLLGHSMGGFFSLCFSLRFPQRVEKLILLGAPAGLNRWIPLMLRALGTPGLNKILIKTIAKPGLANMKSIYKHLLVAHPERLSETFYRHSYYGQKLNRNIYGFTSLLENVLTLKGWSERYYLGGRLHELSVPVGFIWGEEDVFEKPETGRIKALAIKNCQFEVVQNAGHAVWIDQPAETVELLISMLTTQNFQEAQS